MEPPTEPILHPSGDIVYIKRQKEWEMVKKPDPSVPIRFNPNAFHETIMRHANRSIKRS